MAFPDSFIDDLIHRCDIEDVVSDYVQLTKRSGSNKFGLCPFHNEKTPSFSVNSDKQIYHCFGCGKGGSVINFIMEIENLSFPDAVRFLAKRAGVTVPEDDSVAPEQRNRRERLLRLNRDAAKFFYDMLSKPVGEAAVGYMNRRGITKGIAVRFGLGCAPDSWSSLTDAMTAKGYSKQELVTGGLAKISSKTGGVYDTFRNRLMFPVIDVSGNVIGFSGRILGDGEPKYLNSPDTPVFSKSHNLFALNLAKKTKMDMLILVEGNVDVISLHQYGFDCAVASLGTSLTPEQARLMSRYTKQVVIAYDSDTAGKKASERAIEILENTGLSVKVLNYSGAKDPDEFLKKFGADAFAAILKKSEDRIDYRIATILGKYDMNDDSQRVEFLKESADMISRLSNAVEREVYGERAAKYAGVSPEAFSLEVKKAVKRRAATGKKQQERAELRVSASRQPGNKGIRYSNIRSAMAEEGVIRLMFLDPECLAAAQKSLAREDFTSDYLGRVFDIICSKSDNGKTELPSVLASLEPDEASQLSTIMQKPESISNMEKSLADYIEVIKTEKMKGQSDDLGRITKILREKKGYGG